VPACAARCCALLIEWSVCYVGPTKGSAVQTRGKAPASPGQPSSSGLPHQNTAKNVCAVASPPALPAVAHQLERQKETNTETTQCVAHDLARSAAAASRHDHPPNRGPGLHLYLVCSGGSISTKVAGRSEEAAAAFPPALSSGNPGCVRTWSVGEERGLVGLVGGLDVGVVQLEKQSAVSGVRIRRRIEAGSGDADGGAFDRTSKFGFERRIRKR
jgi:hypothetical protein